MHANRTNPAADRIYITSGNQPPRRPSLCLNLVQPALAFPCSRNRKLAWHCVHAAKPASSLAQAPANKNLGFYSERKRAQFP
eukprot:3660631-Pleurochrysis_carterae.AAC.1